MCVCVWPLTTLVLPSCSCAATADVHMLWSWVLSWGLTENILSQGHEGFLNVDIGFSTRLKKSDTMFCSNLFSLGGGYNTLVLHVTLVPQQHPLHVLAGVLIDVSQPFCDVLKAFAVGDVVDQQNTHGPSVVGCGDGMKSFLTSSIPYLKFYLLSFQFDSFNLKVNSYCGDKSGVESVVRETEEHTRLPDSGVSN